MDIDNLIREASRQVERYPGKWLLVLGEEEGQKILEKTGLDPWELYSSALNMGIWPSRYLRNTETLNIREQELLHRSHVAVIGAGGLGGQAITCLARVGVGKITVVDPDRFEDTNLNRQVFASEYSLGQPKASYVAQVLRSINPAVRVRVFTMRFEEQRGKEILDGANVAVDALDSRSDRLALQRACRDLVIPLVHGAVAGLEGHVMTIFPEDIGLEKLYGEEETLEIPPSMRPELILGVLAPTPMLIGTLEAIEAIKVILKREKILRNTMLHMDLETMSFNHFYMG